MLMNGSIPSDASPSFLSSAKPLITHLLQKCEIGNLRLFMPLISDSAPERESRQANSGIDLTDLPEELDPLCIVVSKNEIESANLSPSLNTLRHLTGSPATARRFCEQINIAFDGYEDITLELPEIVEVRNFVRKLDEQFPYWLFFLSKYYSGLQCLLLCLLPPFLTVEGQLETNAQLVEHLLNNRWFPAMNYICQYAGFSQQEVNELSDRAIQYFAQGKFPLDGNQETL